MNVSAQEIQNNLSYRHLDAPHYFRLNYENDLAFHTDYYYTQGVHFELVSPAFNRKIFCALFPKWKGTETRYGVGLESAGYTPTSITADSILYGDRPFAGMAYAKLFSIAMNGKRRTRVTSTLSLGWMGPAAGGYEIQAYIHRHMGNVDPVGWKYQVGNSPVINYEVDYERLLYRRRSRLWISGLGMIRAGTLSTKAALGAVLMAGQLDFNPFHELRDAGLWYCYAYVHPQIEAIGYDATLQGGPFIRDNPYTIAPGDINRIVFRARAGMQGHYKQFAAGISMRYLTKEFVTGQEHLTGGVDIVYSW